MFDPHPRIHGPGIALAIVLHLGAGLGLMNFARLQNTAAAAPVMVSLIDATGQERAVKPVKSKPVKPKTAPVIKSQPAQTISPSSPEPAAPDTPVEEARLQPESSITLPRFNVDYLNNPPPVYPTLSRRMGEQGRVLLRVLVRADGTPEEVVVRHSSGSPRLDRAALETVRKWRFIPAQQGGAAVNAAVLVPISFSLQG